MIFFDRFLIVCPVHLHDLLAIASEIGSCLHVPVIDSFWLSDLLNAALWADYKDLLLVG